ncbi:translocation and assembly module lipoprotein TamL [Alkalitalea saponilacus]|uniref:Outer membrane protein assembly factor BamA n=1 Tax=Alkalitalea saponilacus TaxID=889453 RepID=A0A1T5C980_9BACT|nr:BamA/TamA family outer membrane protein [Alkalitalea saponilacus]ASB49780.1 outer membrane protein assembly factor [Alkalitalea saponilacus]SKB55951.1 Outer membrane protein assembly factor BamA [Alkalitalea saponilacus]
MIFRTDKANLLVFFIFILIVLLPGCRSTKYVPEGERLLTRVQIKNDARDISRDDLRGYIRQQENLRILGFWKLHLGIYNLSGRDDSKGFNRWLRRIGEAPVIYDSTLVDRSVDQMQLFLRNRGYYLAEVSDTVTFPTRRRARVKYTVESGPRYRLNNVYYRIDDDSIRSYVLSDTTNTVLRRGRGFTVQMHNQERDRITENLRNNGFFNFSREFIYFLADSSVGNHRVNDTLVIMPPPQNMSGRTESGNHARYSIRNVFFQVGIDPQERSIDGIRPDFQADTLFYQGFYFVFEDELDFKPEVLLNSNSIMPGGLFRSSQVERTQILLSDLRIFRYINIRFRELEGEFDEHGNKILDCVIHVVPGKYQSYALEVEGTNSSGNLGAAGNIKYQHKNIFNGAELFTLNTRVARQNQFIMRSGSKEQFNTMEFGAESSVVFPQFLLPVRIERFRQRYNPKTTIAAAYNYQRRPDYTRTIVNARMGYTWRASRYSTHSFFPLDFNLVNIPSVSDAFKAIINESFLRYAYEDHLIANLNYTYIYNQQEIGQRWRDFWYLRLSLESAGNILDLMAPIWSENMQDGYNTILGIRYAQYLKADIDVRYHSPIDRYTSLTYRFFGGVGIPYRNLNVLPFEKRYFSGGANSIRAWPVRGLGPGSSSDDRLTWYNQTADIKLEANVEYRFPLFWLLEGALFVDVGNIWGIRPEGSMEDGLFEFDRFYRQLAVGTGFGTRFDFNYFIFRIDTGLKLRDPAELSGDRWIPFSRSYNWNDVAFNFAIGYPF